MATYTTDLTLFKDFETAATVGEMVNYTASGAPANNDTDFPIQSVTHASASMSKTGLGSIVADYGSNVTWTSGNYFFFWGVFLPAGAVATLANGGIRGIVGSDITTNYKAFYLGGNDFGRYPYGGWMNFVFDPEGTADNSAGTVPNTAYRWVGIGVNCISAIAKGSPIGLDVIRYGRGELQVVGTDATFTGMASANDATGARWGLFQSQAGSYLWKGLITLGYGGSTTFSDSNKNIIIDDVRKVSSTFNKIEIRNTSSSITWTNISFTTLGTVSRGSIACIDNATVSLTTCTFTDMDTFTFLAGTSALGCTFRRTNAVTAPGSNLTGSIFASPTVTADTSAVIWDVATDPDGYLDNTTFSQSATVEHHAIEFGTSSPTTMTIRGITFTDFDTANNANGSVLHIKRTTGTVTIYTVGCSGTVSYKSAGATVVIVADPVTVAVNVKNESGSNILEARVFVKASNGTGPFPYEESVTISNSGTTATVTHTAHGMATNDKVVISGATSPTYDANNGIFSITYVSDNSYTYTMGSSPGDGSVTGTIISTYVAISGLTDASGNISMSRVFSADQPIIGWARKSTSAPYYKTGPIGGTIDSTTGFSTNVQLILDQ